MKKFIITNFAASYIANLDSVNFTTSGDVTVTGQNGAGKSSLKNALMWALIGSTNDGEKLIPYADKNLPCVEVELFDGVTYTTFRKEISLRQNGITVNCFLNGLPVNLKDFTKFFNAYVFNIDILMDLGSFFKLKSTEQREILTEMFAEISDADVFAADESLTAIDTRGLTIGTHADAMKAMIRKIKQDRATIPALIDELTTQIVEVPDTRDNLKVEIVTLETQLHNVLVELESLKDILKMVNAPREKISDLNSQLHQLKGERNMLKEILDDAEKRLESLREKFHMSDENCPTCGHKIQSDKAQAIRKKITVEGCALAEKFNGDKNKLTQVEKRMKELWQEINRLQGELQNKTFDYTEFNEVVRERDNLKEQIAERKAQIRQITTAVEGNEIRQKRIDELVSQEKNLGRQLADCEHQLALAEKFTRQKMTLVTDAINSNFKFVKFKMFETLKNGTVKNTCEATMNGVPYQNLSKGEKLKAALDVLNTFQKYYGVMFPLLIDDAESYTSNSLIDVENQKILFKVVEGADLHIEVTPQILERSAVA